MRKVNANKSSARRSAAGRVGTKRTRAAANPETKALAVSKPEPIRLEEAIEQALVTNNLISLSPAQRVSLYMAKCRSLGINPLTEPMGYIMFRDDNGQEILQLYLKADGTYQLQKIHRVTEVEKPRTWTEQDFLVAEVTLQDATGRRHTDRGVIPLEQWSKKQQKTYRLSGAALANAMMKVITKANRRCTIKLCGLSMLDESELDTMQVIGGVTRDGRLFRVEEKAPQLEGSELYELAVALAQSQTDSQIPFKERVAEAQESLARMTPAQLEVVRQRVSGRGALQDGERDTVETAERRSGGGVEKASNVPPRSESVSQPSGPAKEAGPAAAQSSGSALLYFPDGDYWRIEVPDSLKAEINAHHKDVFRPLWSTVAKPPGFVVDSKQLGKLIGECERRKISIKARE